MNVIKRVSNIFSYSYYWHVWSLKGLRGTTRNRGLEDEKFIKIGEIITEINN